MKMLKNSIRLQIFILIAVTGCAIFLTVALYDTSFGSNHHVHTLLEYIAAVIAVFIGVVALMRYYTRKELLFLLLGAAFIGTAIFDGYHATITAWFLRDNIASPLDRLLPWSWLSSRFFLAFFMLLTWLLVRREKDFNAKKKTFEARVYLFSIFCIIINSLVFLKLPLPQAYFAESIFHRPEDLLPAGLFLTAFIGLYRARLWQQDTFHFFLLLSVLINFFSQLIMIFSVYLFDACFNSSHIFKIISYLVLLAGLLVSINTIFRRAQFENRSKTSFLAHMSHEIRTPISGIIGAANLFARAGYKEKQELISMIQDTATSLLAIINDILDLTKIEAGRVNVARQPEDLHYLVQKVGKLIKTSSRLKGLDFEVEITEGVPRFIYCDKAKIRQVLLNLLGNSLKFTEKGFIQLKVQAKASSKNLWEVTFSIIDSGVGIDEAEKGDIFKPFMQSDISDVKKFSGTGLGLTISSMLASQMNGYIDFESHKGQGSKFDFAIVAEEAPPIEASVQKKSKFAKYDKRVLLAEDDPVNQRILTKIFEELGCEVEITSNGLQALHLAYKEKFDLICLDLHMPKQDGFSTALMIRSQSRPNKKTTIIAVTADVYSDLPTRATAAGIYRILVKPVDMEVLQMIFEELFGQYEKPEKNKTSPG